MKKILIISFLIAIRCSSEADNQSTTTDGDTSTCGDGFVDAGEECDDGNNITEECEYGEENCNICNANCEEVSITHICGDGVCDVGEYSSTCLDDCPNTISSISLGDGHTCAIRNGKLFCWGRNNYGQLGDGTNGVDEDDVSANKNTPTRIGNNSDWTHISLDGFYTCGFRNGKLFCWGRNNHGQLGDGTNDTKNTPVHIGDNPNWTHIVLSYGHTCGIRDNGQLFCWGRNDYGQLGDGTNGVDENDTSTDKNIPTRIGNNSDWTHIVLGFWDTCGFRNNGQLFCWGRNDYGQLGDGTSDTRNTPTRIGNNSDWTHIALGYSHACGICNNGQLFCWGKNNYGQLGDRTNGIDENDTDADKNIPTRIGDNPDWTHIALENQHTCGICNNGQLFCWGKNDYGQLGDGTNNSKNAPTPTGNNSDWIHIALGFWHTCGFRDNGQLFCWGRNNYGQLGEGTNGIHQFDTTTDKNTPTLIDFF